MKLTYEDGKAIQEYPPAMGIYYPEGVLWQWVVDVLRPVMDGDKQRDISGMPFYVRQPIPQYGEGVENNLIELWKEGGWSGIHFVHLSGVEFFIPKTQISMLKLPSPFTLIPDLVHGYPSFTFSFVGNLGKGSGSVEVEFEFLPGGHILMQKLLFDDSEFSTGG